MRFICLIILREKPPLIRDGFPLLRIGSISNIAQIAPLIFGLPAKDIYGKIKAMKISEAIL